MDEYKFEYRDYLYHSKCKVNRRLTVKLCLEVYPHVLSLKPDNVYRLHLVLEIYINKCFGGNAILVPYSTKYLNCCLPVKES